MMMAMMADLAEQKRRTEEFLAYKGGARVGGGSCGAASNKRLKIGCGSSGGSVSAKMCRISGLLAPARIPSSGPRFVSTVSAPSVIRIVGPAARVRRISVVRCGGGERSSSGSAMDADFDAKAFRHNLTRSKNYNRRGFGHKEETLQLMNREYTKTWRRASGR